MFRETPLSPLPGVATIIGLLLLGLGDVALLARAIDGESVVGIVIGALVLAGCGLATNGFFTVAPNSGAVVTLFGRYVGTALEPGLWWTNPFTKRRAVSKRVRNLETAKLKVNDNNSNPIEIAAIVVWRVSDTAEACFEVDDFERYVNIQSEAAVRSLASHYPYDAHKEGEPSLSTHADEVSKGLHKAVEQRLSKAGVTVIEARLSHLAYAPEIAAAMLQRQQASALIAARYKIVEGAVGMVENALELLSQKGLVQLDEERKAAMVSNLLVVLCSDRAAQPVVNTGSLYT